MISTKTIVRMIGEDIMIVVHRSVFCSIVSSSSPTRWMVTWRTRFLQDTGALRLTWEYLKFYKETKPSTRDLSAELCPHPDCWITGNMLFGCLLIAWQLQRLGK